MSRLDELKQKVVVAACDCHNRGYHWVTAKRLSDAVIQLQAHLRQEMSKVTQTGPGKRT